jgi:hypothetical protein
MPTATANAIYAVSGDPFNKVHNSRIFRMIGRRDNLSPRVRGLKDSSFSEVDCDMVLLHV